MRRAGLGFHAEVDGVTYCGSGHRWFRYRDLKKAGGLRSLLLWSRQLRFLRAEVCQACGERGKLVGIVDLENCTMLECSACHAVSTA